MIYRRRMGAVGDYAPSYGNALPGTSAQNALLSVVAPAFGGGKGPSAAVSATLAAAAGPMALAQPAAASGGPCGVEPPRTKPGPGGTLRYDDAAAGQRYVDCLAGLERAAEKSVYDAIASGRAGGEGGCGPDPSDVHDSGSEWTGSALRKVWAECRARALPPQAKPAPSRVVAIAPRVEVSPGVEVLYPAPPLPMADPLAPIVAGGRGGSFVPYYPDVEPSAPSVLPGLERAANGGDSPLVQTPVSASIDVPSELWIGLGILAAATVLGGVFLATRKAA